jgi:DNA-binding protein HU-beta
MALRKRNGDDEGETRAKAMTKSRIVAALAEKVDIRKKTAAAYLEALAQLAYKEAKNGFVIPDVGKLVVRQYKARMGRNPQTGEASKIPAKRRLKFVVAKAAKDAALGSK